MSTKVDEIMKILIVYMMLHELRMVEATFLFRRWQGKQEKRELDQPIQTENLSDETNAMRRLFDGRTTWRENADRSFAPFYHGISSMQRKRIAAGDDTPDIGSTSIHTLTKSVCSCESQHELHDLGDGYYPRYLTSSRCKPKSCRSKLQSCRLLQYTVHVLRRRDSTNQLAREWYTDESNEQETPLPESLRHKWQLKPISVAVACVPSHNCRRN